MCSVTSATAINLVYCSIIYIYIGYQLIITEYIASQDKIIRLNKAAIDAIMGLLQ